MSSFPLTNRYQISSTSVPSQRSQRQERIARLVACINETPIPKQVVEDGEGSGSSDMSESGSSSESESEDEPGSSFDLEWGEREEALLRVIEEKYAQEKRLSVDDDADDGDGDEVEVENSFGDKGKKVGGGDDNEDTRCLSRGNVERKGKMPLGDIGTNVIRNIKREVLEDDATSALERRRRVPSNEHVPGGNNMSGVGLCTGAQTRIKGEEAGARAVKENERQGWKELEARVRKIREQKQALEELEKQKREAIEQQQAQTGNHPLQIPLSNKQRKRNWGLAAKERRIAKKAELSRLRSCERELSELRASQSHPVIPPNPRTSLYALRQAARVTGNVNRIEVLRRARQEQGRMQEEEEVEVEDQDVQEPPESSAPTTMTLVKEEPETPQSSQLLSRTDENTIAVVPQPNDDDDDVIANCVRVERTENEDGEFRFEFIVDLKGFGKRRRSDSRNEGSSEENTVAKITKMAICVESPMEYRVSLSGERPSKRLRDEETEK